MFGCTEDMCDLCVINVHACTGMHVCLYIEMYVYMQIYVSGKAGGGYKNCKVRHRPEFRSCLCHCQAVWSWTNCFISQGLDFA